MNIKNNFKLITSLLLSAVLFIAVSPSSMASGSKKDKRQQTSKQPNTTSTYYGKKGKKKPQKSGESSEKRGDGLISSAMKKIADQDREVIRHYQSCDEIPESLRPVGSVEDYRDLIPQKPGLGYRQLAKQQQGKTPQSAAIRSTPCAPLTQSKSPAAKKKTLPPKQLQRLLRLYLKNRRM